MNLLLLLPSDQVDHSSYVVRDKRSAHILEVLRLGPGDTLAVALLNGPTGRGRIEAVTGSDVRLTVDEFGGLPCVLLDIDLILAIPRPKTLRKVLVTCGMMGIRSLHLTRAYRTEKSYLLSPLLQKEEYLPYLLDGLAQGKLTRLTEVHVHHLFRPFVEDVIPDFPASSTALKLMPDLVAISTLHEVAPRTMPSEIMLAIGPEGGWVPFERELLQHQGFVPVHLGPWTLRVETAVAVAVGQLELLRQTRISRS